MAAVQLAKFLSEAGQRRFAWGEHDCILFAADWVQALTGIDPAEKWRGQYDERDAKDVLLRVGGFGPLIHNTLTPLGWRARVCASRGDVVVVRAPTRSGKDLVCGVCAGTDRYALLTARGLVVGPAMLVLAWHWDAQNNG